MLTSQPKISAFVIEFFHCQPDKVDTCPDVLTMAQSEMKPGSSIQCLITRAKEGDMIFLEPGIYHQSFVIDKGITIRGSHRKDTFIILEEGSCIEAAGASSSMTNITVSSAHQPRLVDCMLSLEPVS